MTKKIDCLSLVLYCSFIYWLSSRESLPTPLLFEHQDKLLHAGAYAVMSFLAWRCFRHFITTPIILTLLSIVFCSLYGASDEWHQSFVIGRDSSVGDWVADTVGAMLGAWVSTKFSKPIMAKRARETPITNCAFACMNCAYHDAESTTEAPLNSKM